MTRENFLLCNCNFTYGWIRNEMASTLSLTKDLLFEIHEKMQMMDLHLKLISSLNVILFDEQSITITLYKTLK